MSLTSRTSSGTLRRVLSAGPCATALVLLNRRTSFMLPSLQMRKSALELLSHPWLKNPTNHLRKVLAMYCTSLMSLAGSESLHHAVARLFRGVSKAEAGRSAACMVLTCERLRQCLWRTVFPSVSDTCRRLSLTSADTASGHQWRRERHVRTARTLLLSVRTIETRSVPTQDWLLLQASTTCVREGV